MSTLSLLRAMLASRLDASGAEWLAASTGEIARGVTNARFCALLSLASRHAGRGRLAPSEAECASAAARLSGWNPERWTLLETARVALVLVRPDLAAQSAVEALEDAFRYADVGELCALYRSLAHLPDAGRFAWRAGEGARSNMRVVFEATCCDTPFPAEHFDEVAWRSAVIKCLFNEAPLWRVSGLDRRLSPELARMALDFADERRSAGRAVNPELWLCLGVHGGERGTASLERELESGSPRARAAAAIGLARAGELDRLTSLVALERDPLVHDTMLAALEGRHEQRAFMALDPSVQGAC